jgi:hypothetical protein
MSACVQIAQRRLASSRVFTFSILCLIATAAGCTREETQGDLKIWTYESWVGVVAILAGIAVTVGALALRKSGFGAYVVAFFAIAFTVGFAPFGFVDYIKLDKEHVSTRWGFWFTPTIHEIRFDDVSRVDHTKEEKRGRRGRKSTSYYLVFTSRSGVQDKLGVGNSLMKAAKEEIVLALAAKGLEVNDLTGE